MILILKLRPLLLLIMVFIQVKHLEGIPGYVGKTEEKYDHGSRKWINPDSPSLELECNH